MYSQRIGARAEYLQQERDRIDASATLAEKFPALRSLGGILAYFYPRGTSKHSETKCTFNLPYAKSLFRCGCPNGECVGGGFDLSPELVEAVAEHRETVSGEARCQGWQSKTTIDRVHCDYVLRYKLSLGY